MGRKPKSIQERISEGTIKELNEEGVHGEPQQQATAFVRRESTEDTATKKRRLSFNVTEDGRVDWDSLKGKNEAAVREVFKSDPEIMRLAGKTVEEEQLFKFTTKDAKDALRILNETNSFMVRLFFGRFKKFPIDEDICQQAFRFAPEDEQVLSERGANLLNRYSSAWLREHAELVMFLGLYFNCVRQQAMNAVMGQLQRNEQRERQVKPNGGAEQPKVGI